MYKHELWLIRIGFCYVQKRWKVTVIAFFTLQFSLKSLQKTRMCSSFLSLKRVMNFKWRLIPLLPLYRTLPASVLQPSILLSLNLTMAFIEQFWGCLLAYFHLSMIWHLRTHHQFTPELWSEIFDRHLKQNRACQQVSFSDSVKILSPFFVEIKTWW